MRTLSLIALLAASGTPPRFFARDVDFWGRPSRTPSPAAYLAEAPGPPGPARDLLERPSPETARRYLEWQKERLERLQRALEALEAAAAEDATSATILLFARDDCPYSRAQEEALRGLPVTAVRFGSQPELWSRHGVTATPTIVVNGQVFRGLTDRAVIERAWRAGGRP